MPTVIFIADASTPNGKALEQRLVELRCVDLLRIITLAENAAKQRRPLACCYLLRAAIIAAAAAVLLVITTGSA